MKRLPAILSLFLALTAAQGVRAQGPNGPNVHAGSPVDSRGGITGVYSGPNSPYGSPGNYGTSWGSASYGVPRTYSSYSSSFGPGYAYGYPPYGFLPGRYGVGLWRPGFEAPGYVYGTSYYQTFPVPFRPLPYGGSVPMGYYAPGFGAAGSFAY